MQSPIDDSGSRSRRPLLVVALLVFAVVAVGLGAYALGRGSTADRPTGAPTDPNSGSPSPATESSPPSPTPSPSPSPSEPTSVPLRVGAVFPHEARGVRLALDLRILGLSADCREGTYPFRARRLRAFYFQCSDVAGDVYEPYLFYVEVRNRSSRPIRVSLARFVLVTRDGDSQQAVSVRDEAAQPENFLPRIATIPPQAAIQGYVAFDGRSGINPDQLTYLDPRQTLAIRLVGVRELS